MPRLDNVIEKMFLVQASEVVLETGSGISLRAKDGLTPLIKQPLGTAQIIGAIAELLPPDMKNGYPEEGETRFPYSAPSGPVLIVMKHGEGKVAATIAPYGKPPGSARLDSPEYELTPPAETPKPRSRPAAAAPAPTTSPTSGSAKTSARSEPLKKPVAAAPAPPEELEELSPTEDPTGGDPKAAIGNLLRLMLSKKASDLHLTAGEVPRLRIDGDIVAQPELGVMNPESLKSMLWCLAPARNREQWEQTKDTDFAYEIPEARFRVNVFCDRSGIGAVLRQIPNAIKSAEEMGLPKHVLDLCFLTKGLVLVTGPTGSGKSTTLAAMVDFINRNREDHIITIEDPIEFVHRNKSCLINQREVGVHTQSFKQALRAALREDPDVVLVGELRDLETIAIAIETAETGHLVFGTLHTNTAASTVDRIIDQFPADRQAQIRTMLSESLKGVISQTLCKKIGGGRAAAQEILICTGSVANLIREGKTFQIQSIMQTGRSSGMQTLNDALFELVKKKLVEPTDAYMKAVAKGEFKAMLERGGFKVDLPNA